MSKRHDVAGLGAFLLITFGAAQIGRAVTEQSLHTWYPSLKKPAWTPPGRVIAVVWTVLYTFIGISGWLVWRRGASRAQPAPAVRRALVAWTMQLFLNVSWSLIFFGMRRIDGGIPVIGLLLAAIADYARRSAQVSPLAAALLIPYLAWVTFAGALNFHIWQLNRPGKRPSAVP